MLSRRNPALLTCSYRARSLHPGRARPHIVGTGAVLASHPAGPHHRQHRRWQHGCGARPGDRRPDTGHHQVWHRPGHHLQSRGRLCRGWRCRCWCRASPTERSKGLDLDHEHQQRRRSVRRVAVHTAGLHPHSDHSRAQICRQHRLHPQDRPRLAMMAWHPPKKTPKNTVVKCNSSHGK